MSVKSEATATAIVDRIGEVSVVESSFIKALAEGDDIQAHGAEEARGRALAAAWLAEVGQGLLLTSSDDIQDLKKALKSTEDSWGAAEDAEQLTQLIGNPKNTKFTVTSYRSAGQFVKDGGDLSMFKHLVVEGIDAIGSGSGLQDLEAILSAAKTSEVQIVLLCREASLHLTSLGRKFLNTPKTCSLKDVPTVDVEHWYYEVATTLLAKPQALCDLIEVEQGKRVVVFCNSPSDADFADVILKKRGINSAKLIGYVPQLKLTKAIQQLQKEEISVLVLTDVAARGVPLEEFDIVMNYSVPADPEVYFHRYTAVAGTRTSRIVSLVAALDIANFHYLKKLGKLEITKGELPSQSDVLGRKIELLKKAAVEKAYIAEPALPELVDSVLKDENLKDIVALLLHNTLTVIPSLKSSAASVSEAPEGYGDEQEYGDDSYSDRGGRGGDRRNNNQRGGDRDRDRGGRNAGGPRRGSGGSYDDEDSRGNSERGERNGGPSNAGNRNGRRRNQDSEGGSFAGGEAGEGSAPRERGPRRPPMVVDRDARLYVGQGLQHGLTAEKLVETIVAACGVSSDVIKRVNLRDCYSFVDVPEEVSDQVAEELNAVDASGAPKLFVRKAVVLSIPRSGGAVNESESESSDHAETSEFTSGGESESDDFGESGSSEGPTLLAVDDE